MHYEHSWLLITGISFSVFSLCAFWFKKHNLSVVLLMISALFLRLFIVHMDHFLHNWDEKFHALVARNMMDHPFKPMLYSEIFLPYDYQSWTGNHVWLHKQPLFMWQMALSMKLFGVSEFTARYPSALMGAVMVFFVYRLCFLLLKDHLFAFAGGLLMCCSNYQLELTSGFIGMDHNDVAFGFYVLASVWAYAESLNSRHMAWVILVGVFAGCAILNKWLTGLIIFGAWGINILLTIRRPGIYKEIIRMGIAVLACVVVFVPWQLYILNNFQPEASHEFAYNSKHVFNALENHGGDWKFFYKKLPQYFGHFTWGILLIGGALFVFMKTENKHLKLALLSVFLIIFLFFSLVVKTKMQSYVFVVGPIGYIFMAYATVKPFQWLPVSVVVRNGLSSIAIVVCAVYLFNYPGITNYFHSADDPERRVMTKNTAIYKNIGKYLQPDTKYVINLSETAEIEFMFYNKDIIAYHGKLNNEAFKLLATARHRVGIFKNHGSYTAADQVHLSPQFYIIDVDLEELPAPRAD